MNRSLALLSSVVLLSVSASAQCYTTSGVSVPLVATGSDPAMDEGLTAEIPLGFNFPMAGVAYTITHIVISSNGEGYLTDGTGVVTPIQYGMVSASDWGSAVGDSARIAAMGGDQHGNNSSSTLRSTRR